jgi:hypothetical protein
VQVNELVLTHAIIQVLAAHAGLASVSRQEDVDVVEVPKVV